MEKVKEKKEGNFALKAVLGNLISKLKSGAITIHEESVSKIIILKNSEGSEKTV